jgi:anti-anti-sigma regulatory factor
MLLVPIIGMIDTQRARALTEQLLGAVRDNRAKVVVMDITGVQAVDSKVGNHLVQTVEAARLMGATVIAAGVSPEIAQTMVTLGIDLGRMSTWHLYSQGGGSRPKPSKGRAHWAEIAGPALRGTVSGFSLRWRGPAVASLRGCLIQLS